MKVKELIDKLKTFDQDTEITCASFYSELQDIDYGDGYADFDLVEKRVLHKIDDITDNEGLVIIECVEVE